MRKFKIVLATLFFAAVLPAKSQNLVWDGCAKQHMHFSTYRHMRVPQTMARQEKGQWRVDLGAQFHWPYYVFDAFDRDTLTTKQYIYGVMGYFGIASPVIKYDRNDHHISFVYTPWDNVTLGVSYIGSHRGREFGQAYSYYIDTTVIGWGGSGRTPTLKKLETKVNVHGFEFNGTYHRFISRSWAVEARMGLGLLWGQHRYPADLSLTHPGRGDDVLRYNVFNHNIDAAISAFSKSRRKQITFLLSGGYALYFNAHGELYNNQLREQVANYIVQYNYSYYFDPAIMFTAYGRKFFSFQMHVGYPIGFRERELRTYSPSYGVTLRFQFGKRTEVEE